MDDFSELAQEQKDNFLQKFDLFLESIKSQTLIAVIRDNFRRFEDREYQSMLREVASIVAPTPPSSATGNDIPKVKVEYVKTRDIKLEFNKPWLEDETDVNSYVAKMKEALLKEIRDGKRIQI